MERNANTSRNTKEPWAQGVTLTTARTRRWTAEQVAANNAIERRMIFAGFSHFDEGRSRVRIAVCEREEDARRIVACVNACAGIDTEEIERGSIVIFAGATSSLWDGKPGGLLHVTTQRDDLQAKYDAQSLLIAKMDAQVRDLQSALSATVDQRDRLLKALIWCRDCGENWREVVCAAIASVTGDCNATITTTEPEAE